MDQAAVSDTVVATPVRYRTQLPRTVIASQHFSHILLPLFISFYPIALRQAWGCGGNFGVCPAKHLLHPVLSQELEWKEKQGPRFWDDAWCKMAVGCGGWLNAECCVVYLIIEILCLYLDIWKHQIWGQLQDLGLQAVRIEQSLLPD